MKNISLDRTQRSCTISKSLILGTLILETKLTGSKFALRWYVASERVLPSWIFPVKRFHGRLDKFYEFFVPCPAVTKKCSWERTYSQEKGNKRVFRMRGKPCFPSISDRCVRLTAISYRVDQVHILYHFVFFIIPSYAVPNRKHWDCWKVELKSKLSNVSYGALISLTFMLRYRLCYICASGSQTV